jgi:prepilin-type N-terminal cleavage/methylation domain-containing protein
MKRRHHTLCAAASQGFSLIEMAIVLLILGTLMGGVLLADSCVSSKKPSMAMRRYTSICPARQPTAARGAPSRTMAVPAARPTASCLLPR